jgi:hypothetical protein
VRYHDTHIEQLGAEVVEQAPNILAPDFAHEELLDSSTPEDGSAAAVGRAPAPAERDGLRLS